MCSNINDDQTDVQIVTSPEESSNVFESKHYLGADAKNDSMNMIQFKSQALLLLSQASCRSFGYKMCWFWFHDLIRYLDDLANKKRSLSDRALNHAHLCADMKPNYQLKAPKLDFTSKCNILSIDDCVKASKILSNVTDSLLSYW